MIVCRTSGIEEDLLAQVKRELVEYMRKCIVGLASLCFLEYNGEGDSVPSVKPQLLYGTPYYQ